MSPQVGRALLGWIVFLALTSAATLFVVEPGTPAFTITVVTAGFSVLVGGALILAIRLLGRR